MFVLIVHNERRWGHPCAYGSLYLPQEFLRGLFDLLEVLRQSPWLVGQDVLVFLSLAFKPEPRAVTRMQQDYWGDLDDGCRTTVDFRLLEVEQPQAVHSDVDVGGRRVKVQFARFERRRLSQDLLVLQVPEHFTAPAFDFIFVLKHEYAARITRSSLKEAIGHVSK
ncbi:MAG: hypothetical protein ACHQ4J_04155 [Candidatus Binatia bacterium]